jgi:HYDIN/CFA65/VesB-like, Ig-like domain/Cep192 domain 4
MLIWVLCLLAASSAQDFQSPLILSPYELSFADVLVGRASAAQAVTILNVSLSPVRIAGIATTGNFEQTNNCPQPPAALGPNAVCEVQITFRPTAPGTVSGTLTISTDARGGSLTVNLSGAGTADLPALKTTPSSLSFGARPPGTTSAPRALTLSNTGTELLMFSSITATGDFTVMPNSTCISGSRRLPPGADCTVVVTFTPLGLGARSGQVIITDNAGDSPQHIELSGTGRESGTEPAPDLGSDSGAT